MHYNYIIIIVKVIRKWKKNETKDIKKTWSYNMSNWVYFTLGVDKLSRMENVFY